MPRSVSPSRICLGEKKAKAANCNTRFVETIRGILSYAELAPLLGERVLACEEAIVTGTFAGRPADELLLQEFHPANDRSRS